MVDLTEIVASAAFVPTNRQIRARNEYYKRNPPDASVLSSVDEMLNSGAPAALRKWSTTPGFMDWWTSPQWEQEEAQRLLMQSMQRVSEILRDEENPGVVISAAREAREIYTKLHTSVAPKFSDEEIGKMDRTQLEEYIRRKTAAVSGGSK